jgi:hypothetical protein
VITFFSTSKPFRGLINVIQRNALQAGNFSIPTSKLFFLVMMRVLLKPAPNSGFAMSPTSRSIPAEPSALTLFSVALSRLLPKISLATPIAASF